MAYAALNNTAEIGPLPMHVNILVNAKGQVCMTHDEDFSATPLWVKYKRSSKEIDILFDNGTAQTVIPRVAKAMDSYLINANRVLLVRIEDQKPVMGWDTILLNETI
jgi:hypothetical protein